MLNLKIKQNQAEIFQPRLQTKSFLINDQLFYKIYYLKMIGLTDNKNYFLYNEAAETGKYVLHVYTTFNFRKRKFLRDHSNAK